MMQKDVQDYLDNAIYGTPQIKPEEKKKYLGTFRERVVFIMTLEEAETTDYRDFCMNQFKAYSNGTLSINANCPLNIQNRLMKSAQQVGISFKMVDTDISTLSSDDIVIVFAVDTAIDLADISVKKIEKKTPRVEEKTEVTDKKKRMGLLKRLLQ